VRSAFEHRHGSPEAGRVHHRLQLGEALAGQAVLDLGFFTVFVPTSVLMGG